MQVLIDVLILYGILVLVGVVVTWPRQRRNKHNKGKEELTVADVVRAFPGASCVSCGRILDPDTGCPIHGWATTAPEAGLEPGDILEL